MSAKLCTNSGGQKPTVLGTRFPTSTTANGVLSGELVHMAWCPCQMVQAALSSKSILVIPGSLPEVARWRSTASEPLQDSRQLFGRGRVNGINLLNEFCKGSLSWRYWLFLPERGFSLEVLSMRWKPHHKASHKSTVLPQQWLCGQVPRNNSKEEPQLCKNRFLVIRFKLHMQDIYLCRNFLPQPRTV